MKKLFSLLLFALVPSLAMCFPNSSVRIIVPVSVGGGPDIQARKLAQFLSEKWKQPVIVENRPGGSGVVAMQELLKAPPDGHTIGMFTLGDIVAFPLLHENNLVNQLQPIAPFFDADMALFVKSDIKNFAQLKEEIKKQRFYGSWGVGSAGHVAGEQFAKILQLDTQHVPYNNMNQWYADTSRGDLTYGFTSFSSGDAMYRAGKINYLGVAASRRDPKFPNVPTIKELTGVPLVSHSWLAFFGHNNLDKKILIKLQKDLRDTIADPQMKTFIEERFYIPMSDITPAEFIKIIANDRELYKKAIKDYNINLKK
jgi:tripartite-type tricarboxylate transporter receptor subunit TctC